MSPTTFMNAPQRSTSDTTAPSERVSAAVLGIPFDAGTHPTRVGARLGPAAIREQSSLIMPFDPATGANLIAEVSLTDRGDAAVVPGDPEASFPAATEAVAAIVEDGSIPIVLGGDGLVSLPTLRALGPRHDGLAVVHLDAHTDSYPGPGYSTAHTFTRAVEEGLIDPAKSFHVGLRGTTYAPEAWANARSLGFNLITMADWRTRGTEEVVAEIISTVGGTAAHLSFDMDVFDPSIAPGVCTPAWGGIAAIDAFDVIDGLAGGNWVGFDNQTVSPPHDVGGMTALLAGTVVAHFLQGLISEL